MSYTLNEGMLRHVRAPWASPEVERMATRTPAPRKITLEELAKSSEEVLKDVKFTPKSFALFMATATHNSSNFSSLSDSGGDTYTFGRITPEELPKFAKWVRETGRIKTNKELTDNLHILDEPEYAWLGLVWRQKTEGLLEGDADPDPEIFLRSDQGLASLRRIYYDKALSLIDVDGSPLDDGSDLEPGPSDATPGV